MGELEVLIDGRQIYSYKQSGKQSGRKPSLDELLAAMNLLA